MGIKNSVFVTVLALCSLCFAEENQSIVFTLPQAIIVNPELHQEYPDFDFKSKVAYSFDFLFQEDSKRWITTKIGSLGFMTAGIDRESRVLSISYFSLPRRMPECEIFLPQEMPGEEAKDYALEMVVLPSKKGPRSLDIQIGLKDKSRSKILNAKLKGPTLILIPLVLFEIKAIADIESIKIVVPKGSDRDGIGSYSIKEPRIVVKQ
ncbi:MAG: hypothetical protein P9X27_00095 [Candidatus Kaelpia aquatica]|nr:hypothetical protein [Candidatus Kaelpia aquatica]